MNLKELKIEYFKSGGPGGQHKNKRFMAVRLTHLPTGITAVGQRERSQESNKSLAFEILKERLAKRLAVRKKRIPTRQTRSAKEKILAHKKAHSLKKSIRREKFNLEE